MLEFTPKTMCFPYPLLSSLCHFITQKKKKKKKMKKKKKKKKKEKKKKKYGDKAVKGGHDCVRMALRHV